MSAVEPAIGYRALVDRLGAIVWEAIPGRQSGQATFTFVSEHTQSLLGYPAERWLADPGFWFEMIHPDDRQRVNEEIVASIHAGRADFEYRARAADGQELWLRNIVQVATTDPELRLSGVLVDVTERKKAEERLRSLQESFAEQTAAERSSWAVLDTIITTAPEAFALFDTSLRYVRVNDALAEMHGLPVDEHVGRKLGDVVPDSGHEGPLREVLETGEPIVDVEISGLVGANSDEPRTWLVSYYPVHDDDGRMAWVGKFMTDITTRKRGEERARLIAELGSLLDSVVTVEERMKVLVEALVPALCTSAAVELRDTAGELASVATRGDEEPSLTLPLSVRGRDLGELSMTFAQQGEPEEDLAFAIEVARRAALAIDNARLFEGERLARERTARQYSVAAALAETLSAADVAKVTLEEVALAIGADHGTMWQVDDELAELHAIGWHGFTDEEMEGYTRVSLTESRPVADTVRSRRTLYLATPEQMDAAYPAMAPGLHDRRLDSIVVFPLITAGRVVGGLLLSAERPHAFSDDDLALGTALAAQAATAVERSRLYETERRVSMTLQRSLLPASLPDVPGVDLDLRYVPAAGLAAGGDFYEAVPLSDGSLLVAVGDVVGRGATAAAAMGQLRSALRAFALAGEGPASLLASLSAFADTVPEAMASTAVVAKLDPLTGELCYACAGHPWPVLASADGTAELLTGGRGVPLGCLPNPQYVEATVTLEPGATLLLYTDGLTERRGEDMDVSLERLRVTMAEHAGEELPLLLDHAVSGAGPEAPADDVALVLLRYTGDQSAQRITYPAELVQVPAARHALRDWLTARGIGGLPAADILLAAGEAMANAVEHSGTNEVHLELAAPYPDVVRIVVRDQGAWRNPVVNPNRGRGFGLMRSLMDECTVTRGTEGTVVRLVRRLAADPPAPEPIGADAAPESCTVSFASDGVAVLAGELDISCADSVRHALTASADLITVDLTAVTHLDSSGARMLFELPTRPHFIAPPGTPPRRTLDVSSLSGVMDVRDS